MEIVGIHSDEVKFGSIDLGECFIYRDELFMRCMVEDDDELGVMLGNGEAIQFFVDEKVRPIKAKVVLK